MRLLFKLLLISLLFFAQVDSLAAAQKKPFSGLTVPPQHLLLINDGQGEPKYRLVKWPFAAKKEHIGAKGRIELVDGVSVRVAATKLQDKLGPYYVIAYGVPNKPAKVIHFKDPATGEEKPLKLRSNKDKLIVQFTSSVVIAPETREQFVRIVIEGLFSVNDDIGNGRRGLLPVEFLLFSDKRKKAAGEIFGIIDKEVLQATRPRRRGEISKEDEIVYTDENLMMNLLRNEVPDLPAIRYIAVEELIASASNAAKNAINKLNILLPLADLGFFHTAGLSRQTPQEVVPQAKKEKAIKKTTKQLHKKAEPSVKPQEAIRPANERKRTVPPETAFAIPVVRRLVTGPSRFGVDLTPEDIDLPDNFPSAAERAANTRDHRVIALINQYLAYHRPEQKSLRAETLKSLRVQLIEQQITFPAHYWFRDLESGYHLFVFHLGKSLEATAKSGPAVVVTNNLDLHKPQVKRFASFVEAFRYALLVMSVKYQQFVLAMHKKNADQELFYDSGSFYLINDSFYLNEKVDRSVSRETLLRKEIVDFFDTEPTRRLLLAAEDLPPWLLSDSELESLPEQLEYSFLQRIDLLFDELAEAQDLLLDILNQHELTLGVLEKNPELNTLLLSRAELEAIKKIKTAGDGEPLLQFVAKLEATFLGDSTTNDVREILYSSLPGIEADNKEIKDMPQVRALVDLANRRNIRKLLRGK